MNWLYRFHAYRLKLRLFLKSLYFKSLRINYQFSKHFNNLISQIKAFLKLIRIDKQDLFIATLSLTVLFIFTSIFTYLYFAKDLVSPESVMNRNDTGVILLDRFDKPFFTLYQGRHKEYVPLSEISELTKKAVIAEEDKDFYSHPGFSIKAIAGALIADIRKKELAFGGSTITQQLVKISLLNQQKSFLRKYQEVILAQEIERRFTKDQILEMYLNSVYFGEGAFGVEEAAQTYFGKSAKNLNLAESTMLAALLPSPANLSPISGDFERAKSRQEFVLSQMLELNMITPLQKDQAQKEQLKFAQKKEEPFFAPHFAFMVRDELIEKYGEETVIRSGFRVKTTLNLDWQKEAENIVKTQVDNLARNNVTNGAAVVENPKTGEILVVVGSKDFYDKKYGQVNIITSQRQPGSSFKPLVYAKALEDKLITPATILKDQPITYKGLVEEKNAPRGDGSALYKPQNYDQKFRGNVLVRRALANSLNVPTIEVISKLGLPKTLDFSKEMGLTTLRDPKNYGLSLALGAAEVKPLELTNAFATFANKGKLNKPTTILEIKDKREQTIYQFKQKSEQKISEETAFLISSILSDNQARTEVFGNALNISRPAAVKTGTTQDYRDAWTVGYTPSLAVGVWVGNNNNQPMDQIAGSLGAAPIWKRLMEKFLAGTPVEIFEPPPGVISKSICKFNGLLLKEATSSATLEYFIRGTEPTKYCTIPASSPSPASSTDPNQPPPPTDPPKEEDKQAQPQGGVSIQIQINGDNNSDKKEDKKEEKKD